MEKLEYPTQETFFICWDDLRTEIKVHSSVLPTQCMETKFTEVDYYIDKQQWVDVLLENGINPFPTDEELPLII